MKNEKDEDLNLDSGWRIGEDAFSVIVKLFETKSPKVIVEFGAGASSVRLAQHFPDAEVISIDHDLDYVKKSMELQHAYGVENLKILHRPLCWQIHGGEIFKSYAQGDLPLSIDAVIIDGPPYFVHLGREACFHQVVQKLSDIGIVVLDDCNRSTEQRAVVNWTEAYPECFERKDMAVGHGICTLVKKGAVDYKISWRNLLRNYRSFAGLVKRQMFEKISFQEEDKK